MDTPPATPIEMPPEPTIDTLEALEADIRVHDGTYEYNGSGIGYLIEMNRDETVRYVAACAFNDTDTTDRSDVIAKASSSEQLEPTWWQELKEKYTSYEYNPPTESEQLVEVLEYVQARIDGHRVVQAGHEDCDLTAEAVADD